MATNLKGADDLQFWAFTRATFPTPESAVPLLRTFIDAGAPFVPTHYGEVEPVRTPFDPDAVLTPARVLSDRPRDLFLKRSRPAMEASLTWMVNRQRSWIWTVRLTAAWLKPATCGPERLAKFFMDLCAGFPPVFAFCATNADLARKHTLHSPTTGDDLGMRGMILNPGEGLPGVYWLTFFGPELVSFFGKDRLLALDVHQIFDCGASGVGILLQGSPDAGTPGSREGLESRVLAALGKEYFFDIAEAAKSKPAARTPVPGATDHS